MIFATWSPDLPFCALILFFIFALYIPDEVRRVRRTRQQARQIVAEHEARKALEKLSR
jgi:hypothetical protein